MNPNFGQAPPSGPGLNGSHGRVNHTTARVSFGLPNATTTSESLRLGGFPTALASRPRAVGPLGSGLHGLAVNLNGQGATSSRPGNNEQGDKSGRLTPVGPRPRASGPLGPGLYGLAVSLNGQGTTSSRPGNNDQGAQYGRLTPVGPAGEIQRYKPPQSASVTGQQAQAPEPFQTTAAMNPPSREPSSLTLTMKGFEQLLQNPEHSASVLSVACNIRQFNPEWIRKPTFGDSWSFDVMLQHHLVPSPAQFSSERKAKGATAVRALKVMFDVMGVSKDAVFYRYAAHRGYNTRPDRRAATTPTINRDVDMTAGRLTQLPVSSALPSTGHGIATPHSGRDIVDEGQRILQSLGLAAASATQGLGMAANPPGRGPTDEGRRLLESLGLVASAGWGHTQPAEMSSTFLQGLAAGAQLSQMLFKNAPSDSGRSSRRYRDRDREPRRNRRSRSPTTERQSTAASRRSRDPSDTSRRSREPSVTLRRSRDPSVKLEDDILRSDRYPPSHREPGLRLSTDRYRPKYDASMPKTQDVAIKTEASTETERLSGPTSGVSASSSGTTSRRRTSGRGSSMVKHMPTDEKWDHDGFARHYPSVPKK